jgi:hypothetical protein
MAQFKVTYEINDIHSDDYITADNYCIEDECVSFYNENENSDNDDLEGFICLYPLEKVIKVERIN